MENHFDLFIPTVAYVEKDLPEVIILKAKPLCITDTPKLFYELSVETAGKEASIYNHGDELRCDLMASNFPGIYAL